MDNTIDSNVTSYFNMGYMYSVHELAKLAGVSVRTLHYYDEIGLLRPSFIEKNGYRKYASEELLRLQQILFFRELDFPLVEIKSVLNQPNFIMVEALKTHKKVIKLKQKRLEDLIKTIDKTIKSMTNEIKIKDEELYDAFKDEDIKEYQQEAKERWGNTDAYRTSMEKVSKMTKAQMDKLKEDGKKFTQKLADNMDKPVGSDEVQSLIEEHYKGIQFFYECPISFYRNLGQMYVDDARFTAYYDKFKPGLAVWLRDAIMVFCDRRESRNP